MINFWVATSRTFGALVLQNFTTTSTTAAGRLLWLGVSAEGFYTRIPSEWKRTASGSGCGCPWALQDVSINILLP